MSRFTILVMLIACFGIVAGCATSGDIATASRRVESTTVPVVPDAGSRIARAALDVLGTPYRYGGSSQSGFDCSGLVQYAHSQAGITIPRTTATQFNSARKVPDSMQIGDVLFFKISGRISHNGIYLGDGRFVHAPSTGKNVSIGRINNPYFRKRLAGIGRFR